jgi:hypothetical protein
MYKEIQLFTLYNFVRFPSMEPFLHKLLIQVRYVFDICGDKINNAINVGIF